MYQTAKWKENCGSCWLRRRGPFVATIEQIGSRYVARFFAAAVHGIGDCDPEDCLFAWHAFDGETAFRRACQDLRQLNRQRWLAVQQAIVARRVIAVNHAVLAGDIILAVALYESIWNAIDRASNSDALFGQLRASVLGSIENLCEV
jgi:hypothetical protein